MFCGVEQGETSALFIRKALFGLGLLGFPGFSYAGVAWAGFGVSLFGFIWNLWAAVRRGVLQGKLMPTIRWARRAAPYLFRVGGPAALGNITWHSGNMVIYSVLSGLPGDSQFLLAALAFFLGYSCLSLPPVVRV